MHGRQDLLVSTALDADEIARFWSKVVRGPEQHCWYWVGAIADDGYGRFWVTRAGRPRVVRPNRYAVALALGAPLFAEDNTLHDCDEPICVRAEGLSPHVHVGTQRENLATMGRRGRGGGPSWRRHGDPDRAARASRSRAIRSALAGGWDHDALTAVLDTTLPGQIALFTSPARRSGDDNDIT